MGTLGKAIREERRKQNLKIKDLAEKIGFSLSYVSQVERDLIVPSLSALRQIAGVLDITPGSLLDGAGDSADADKVQDVDIIRHNERLVLIYPCGSVRNELLLPEYNPDFSIAWLTFPANSTTAAVGDRSHRGKHHVVIISGQLKFACELDEYTLVEGDAIVYDYAINHTWINDKDVAAEVILYIQPEKKRG